jgi:hypothetical protein
MVSKNRNYKYTCEKCEYGTNNKYDYNRHISTKKHINDCVMIQNDILPDTLNYATKIYKCICGNEYKYRSGYYRHKKMCNQLSLTKNDTNETNNEEIDYKQLILQVINQNKELQDLLIKQQEEYKEEQKQLVNKYENLVLHIQPKNNTVIKNSNNKTINNNNNQYNIMMFLNDKCKDAMTIQEFADNLVVSIDDLEKKKIDCLTNTILKNLKSLKITERPVHCGNIKRKEWYLNHKDKGWILDNGENLIKTTEYGINKKYRQEFKSHYPNYETHDQLQDKYTSLVYRILTDLPEHEQSKLLNVVAKDLMIEFE